MMQGLQILGAILLLSGFAAAQWAALPATSVTYLGVNAIGATDLALLALDARAWGFLLLESAWAIVSLAGVVQQLDLARRQWRFRRGPGLVPELAAVGLTGDELAEPGRLVRLFRDSYTASQGRQWVQAHVLWWIALFLRSHGIRPDWDTLTAAHLADTIATLPLPPGHQPVHPPDQVRMNFQLWWPLMAELLHAAYPSRWPGWRHPVGLSPHHVDDLEDRAERVGLRPWMSSATTEELAGIGHAFAVLDCEFRHGQTDADDFMLRVLLPELLIVELRWLHTPGGRSRAGTRPTADIVLLRQYEHARTKRAQGRQLTPLNHLYLHAGDILDHLPSAPDDANDPHERRVVELYREMQSALPDRATSHEHNPSATTGHKETPP